MAGNGGDYGSPGDYGDTGYSGPMPDAAAATYPPNQVTNQLVTPPVAPQPSPVPTRFDMAYGDSLATMQSTNRIDPRMANNRIWGVEGPKYSSDSLPIGQSPSDIWTTNEVGAPPSRIADRIEYQLKENPNFFTTDANGRPINNMFLGIGSNAPGQINDVGRALDALKAANPNLHVVVPAMGPRVPTPNVDAANAALKQAVESRGYTFFQPNLQYSDGVHPRYSGQMFDQANTALNAARPPTVAAAPAPTGLPQPQPTTTNALATGLPAPQSAPAAAPTAPPDLTTVYPGTKLEDAIMSNENVPVGSPGFKMFSSAGAVGPAQILPSTGAPYLSRMLGRPVGNDEAKQLLQDTNTNIKVRDALLTDLKNKYSYLGPQVAPLAVAAAYHSGEGNADAWLMGEKPLGPAGQKYVADAARKMDLDTGNLKLGSYDRPPLSRTSGGYGVGGGVPATRSQVASAGGGDGTIVNQLAPQGGPGTERAPGATGPTPQDILNQANARNEQMRRLALYNYVAQSIANAKRVDPRTLESGYDPGRVYQAGISPVPPLRLAEPPAPLPYARMGQAQMIGEPLRLQVPVAARPGQAQLLPRRRSNIEGI